MEGLGSSEATPNLDVESRGPNHTTILPYMFNSPEVIVVATNT